MRPSVAAFSWQLAAFGSAPLECQTGGRGRMGGGSGGSGPGQWQLLQKEAELRLAVALSECLGFRRAEGAAVARQLL